MKVVATIGVATVPIVLYGCGSGLVDDEDTDLADGVEHDRSLEQTQLWGLALAGRRCKNGGNKIREAKTILQCQQKAVDAGLEFFSYKEGKRSGRCLIQKKCDMIEDDDWTTYVKPVPGHPADTCPTTSCTTTTTSTHAPWTHVEILDFEKWQEKFGKYFDPEEEKLRRKIFRENTKAVERHNRGSNKWWKAQTQFSHLLQSEFEELLTLDASQLPENSNIPVFEKPPGDGRRLEDLDDTARHWSVSPVKDQGTCGSCWAFAAVAGLESAARVQLARSDILSEQQVMDCTSSAACQGGNTETAYPELFGDALYTGSSYPYLNTEGSCHTGTDSGLRFTSYIRSVPTSATDADLIAGLNGNPLVVYVDATLWSHYNGGIYHDFTSCSVNHAVLAVGYDKDYYKLKNSWATTFGEDGYIRIGRNEGACGTDGTSAVLKSGGFYPVVTANGNPTSDPTAPTTCTCKFTADNFIHEVYIDGKPVTSELSDWDDWRVVKSVSFTCSASTLLAVKASDADIDGGCATGSFMLECSANDPSSPWNGLISDSSWKAWGGLCSSPGCENGVSSQPPGWYLPSFDDTAWDNAKVATSALEKSILPWVNLPEGICNPDGPGWLFRSPRFDASNRCTCTMDSNNFIQKVYVDGEDVTSQVSGDLGDSNSLNSLSFACSATTLLAVQASDSKDGCSTGGFALKCSADNPLSPWNGMVADNTWKAWGADCPTPACETGVTSPPKEWFLPSFDASKWDNAAKATGTVAAGVVGTPADICSDEGKGWLFRTPRCTCEFNSDNYIHKVYVDGEDVTSQVSGDLNNWKSVNSLSFTCSATTRLAVQASDGDMNGGCLSGEFALRCSADDAASPWNGLTANDKWKAFGGSCHVVSDDKTGCVSGVSSPPKGWFLPSFDDSNWDNAAISPRTEAASMVKAPSGICDSNGPGWLFRSPNLAR